MSSLVLSKSFSPHASPLSRIENSPIWISNKVVKSRNSYFRKEFSLSANVENAWIAVGARDSFELLVNGNTVGRYFLWRPTRPFQSGFSENGQKLNKEIAALSLNYPREYQWDAHMSYLLPSFFDIRPFLKKGKNVISLKVESRKEHASMYAFGEISLTGGKKLSLISNAEWKSKLLPTSNTNFHWSHVSYDYSDWSEVEERGRVEESLFTTFSTRVFSEPFNGKGISAQNMLEADALWFEKDWYLESQPRDAWVRLFANRKYSLFINNKLVKVPGKKSEDQDSGEWIINTSRVEALPASPELLDIDEIGAAHSGSQFESTPHSDPTLNEFKGFQNTLNKAKERPFSSGMEGQRSQQDASGKAFDSFFDPNSYRPSQVKPKSHVPKINESFYAYSISSLLRKGKNKIEVRFSLDSDAQWLPLFAFDAEAIFSTKKLKLSSDDTWKYQLQNVSGERLQASSASVLINKFKAVHPLKYKGIAYSYLSVLKQGIFLFLLHVFLLFCILRFIKNSEAFSYSLVVGVFVIACFFLLESAFFERSERIFFSQSFHWILVSIAAFLSVVLVFFRLSKSADSLTFASEKFIAIANSVNKEKATIFMLLTCLFFCFFLRAYKLDFQPFDDDEYSSIQALLSIAESGVPKFNEDIWYTRSPLYHYLVGGIVWLFGNSVWALRLPSVFFGVLTAWLIFKISDELLENKFLAFSALFLYSIHPFAIYSAHIARFYQQQQFFFLLTIYFFIKGFVLDREKYSYAMIFSLLFAVLSQEISVILGLQIVFAYLLFSNKKSFKENVILIILGLSAISLIGIDLLIFQIKCLTRLEGVSPNLEATLAPNIGTPMNFLSLLFSYSRLHVALSFFFLVGIPFCLKNMPGKKSSIIFILYFFSVSGALITNVLVTGVSLRYQYSFIPLWLILSLYGAFSFVEMLTEALRKYSSQRGMERHKWFSPLLHGMLLFVFILSFSPWRIVGSYDAKILGDSTGALQFVKQRLVITDKIAITEPHPHAAKLELGRVDYDLAVPLLYDFVYKKDSKLIDRNGSAEVIAGVEDLQKAVESNDRLWVLVNREKFRSRGKNIRWEYPGARVELFLRENFEIKYESYLWTVFLWDVSLGKYKSFRKVR